MNIGYLKTEIIPIREKEIEEGKNLATLNPIYVVLDLCEQFVSGHTDYTPTTNYKGKLPEFGYFDTDGDPDEREFENVGMGLNVEPVTKFYTDRIVAFFLTSQGAYDYLKYQSHNLRDPYVYVFNVGYRNYEMNVLFNDVSKGRIYPIK